MARRVTLALLVAPMLAVVVVAGFLPAPRSDAAYCTAATSGVVSMATLGDPNATADQVVDAFATLISEIPDTLTESPSTVRDQWMVVLRWARASPAGDVSQETPPIEEVVAAADAIDEDYETRCQVPLFEGETGGLDDD